MAVGRASPGVRIASKVVRIEARGSGLDRVEETLLAEAEGLATLKRKIAILVGDATCRRLAETASVHLELVPEAMTEAELSQASLEEYEFLLADEPIAARVHELLNAKELQGDELKPALIAVVRKGAPALKDAEEELYEGVLPLPQEPAAVVSQLGLILYAHRAFARRYQSALEELHLNRRIFRSVTSGISVSNAQLPDLPLVYVNPAFEVMTGYSLEEVQGINCRFLQKGERDQPGVTLIREAIQAQREVVAILKNFRKDGTAFWNELSLSPIFNREGVLTHFVGIQSDVTARVEFEAALRESEKLAAVGRLAASIAHEINNPLESVMNLLYLARETEAQDESRRYLDQADRELQRVAQITTQSLRFYKQSTKPQAVLCTELVESVLDLYHGRFLNSGVRVERRERMTQSIVCLESEIRQVLSNLVRNAVDAMHGTGGRLLVRSREATDWRSSQKGVMLTFADTGTGISADTMSKLYKAFFTTKGIGGTGLGLWVSAEIIERHHGRLLVRSSAKRGASWTVFELFLPYQGLPG